MQHFIVFRFSGVPVEEAISFIVPPSNYTPPPTLLSVAMLLYEDRVAYKILYILHVVII
jgi:hypothetical protein